MKANEHNGGWRESVQNATFLDTFSAPQWGWLVELWAL